MVFVLDNHDSFTYNLVQVLRVHTEVAVGFADQLTVPKLQQLRPDALLISPGPGRPEDGGCSIDAIRHFAGRIPVLGVCLGHQALGVAFGARVVHAGQVMHGKTSRVFHRGSGLFEGSPNPFEAMRYHSLVVDPTSMRTTQFEIDASTVEGVVMAMTHEPTGAVGLQFHPESIGTPHGPELLARFVAQSLGA